METNELKLLQQELLSIFKVFAEACDKAGLTYYMLSGTLIGAVRHHGFIPWDDDLDVAMPREDYNRFIALYKDRLTDDYYLDGYCCNEYTSNSPLLRVNSRRASMRRDRNGQETYIPAFVGLHPIDGLPNSPLKRKLHLKRIAFLYGMLRASRSSIYGLGDQNNRTARDNIFVRLNSLIKLGRFLKPAAAAKKVDKCMAKYPLEGSKYCYVINYVHLDHYYLTEDFEGAVSVPFEDTTALIPKGYDRILRTMYGNYMELPPVEKRVPGHGVQIKFHDR